MNRLDGGKASLATLLVLATTVACSNSSATPAVTRSGTATPGPFHASPSPVASPTATVTPGSGIAAAGTAGPSPDPADLPGKTAPCAPESAIALGNGKILTWDGCWTLFDPATGMFTPTGSTTIAFQTDYQPPNPAVLLKSGQVYFPNGEIYDPATGRFYPVGVRVASSTATLLPDGRVFVLAYDTTDHNEFVAGHVAPQIYDPRTGKATPAGPMPFQLDGLAITLADGRVLVLGPAYPLQTKQGLLYDPTTNTFARTGSTRMYPSCIANLGNGRVLVAGDPDSPIAEVYDPGTEQFTTVAPMVRLMAAQCVTLADGRVLALGTVASDQDSAVGPLVCSAEIYDPKANRWTDLGNLVPNLLDPVLVALPDGRAVVLGGDNDTAQFFDPKTNKFVANN